ncbi:putative inner membrane transporter YicL [Apilactobacillus kunkeei]|nr:putative inner membrane transporter YicL [Apilactobacillus kunkeei]CAI2578483.1 putative inner membrane transporter YicL [Apilactobacillus kunkeei]
MIAFALLGMLPYQLTYFMAIRYGNAPTATVLQFLGPIFIMGYVTVFNHKLPNLAEIFSVILALAGTFLLVTNGPIDSLALSIAAIAWGIGAGVSQASYTLIPAKLLSAFDDKLIVWWGMLLGSLPLSGFVLSTSAPKVSMITIISIAFIIVFGTMLSYLLYLMSTKYISPSVTGMLSAFEPLIATVLSVAFLGTHLAPVQLLGGLFIIATVFVQTIFNRKD